MVFEKEKRVLPAFPRTPHLPYKPNAGDGDIVATSAELLAIEDLIWTVEEKIDGASVGMALWEDEPLIRNRDHILRKGYVKETAAKKQFASIWGWFYDHKKAFEYINSLGSYSVYGEWCVAQHGIAYTKLPDWFIAYDLYDYDRDFFLDSEIARRILGIAGFHVPQRFLYGSIVFDDGMYEEMEQLVNTISPWAEERVEGIYLKGRAPVDDKIVARFKMVREDYERGKLWNPKKLTKNKLA